ncbi:MAG: hypothetical protein AAGF76_00605 [Pseudomonadota bacterium]
MNMSPNWYLAEPRLFSLATTVDAVEPIDTGGTAILCKETIFRPAGGGQPADHGTLEIEGTSHIVVGIAKASGRIRFEVPSLEKPPTPGTTVVQHLDTKRRDALSRLHTIQHMLSAILAREAPNTVPVSTGIAEDAGSAWVHVQDPGQELTKARIAAVDIALRSAVLKEAPVRVSRAKSLADAAAVHRKLFRIDPSITLGGKVRVVTIDGIDANCCSGTHWMSSNIGSYTLEAGYSGANITLTVTLVPVWMYWFGDRLP